jgi:hypothetical protein
MVNPVRRRLRELRRSAVAEQGEQPQDRATSEDEGERA